MLRYRLRTLLIVLAILPPVIAYWYRQHSDLALWQRLTDAKLERDACLSAWRQAYDDVTNGKAPPSKVDAEQDRYFKLRENVERARAKLVKRYGGEQQMIEALTTFQKQRPERRNQ